MTEQQQYRVIADRDEGDDMPKRFMRGDRVTFGADANGRTVPVRIERPMPTTVEIHELVDVPLPPDDDPSLPTREQIAEAIAKAEDADYWVEEIRQWEAQEEWEREAYIAESYPAMAYEDRESFLRAADAVLALLQKGADR